MRTRKSSTPKIALALAGGGPLGAIYEIGALCALDEALDGLPLVPRSTFRIALREGLDKLGQAIQPGLRQAL